MILQAQEALQLDLAKSWMIGDHDRDIKMAMHAGVPKTIRILSEDHSASVPADFTLASTDSLLDLLKTHLPCVNA